MNILVITKAAWDDRIASGNTLSNFFNGWKDVNFFCLYSREAMPNNNVCSEYYSVSPISIVKNLFRPSKIGKRFRYDSNSGNGQNPSKEVKIISTAKRNRTVFEFAYNLAYTTDLWKNKSFKKFIAECNPDLVFCFGSYDPLNHKALKYIKSHTNAKIISYYVDDLFRHNVPSFYFVRKLKNKRLLEIASMSDKCYAISQRMCDEYCKLYGKSFQLLHKGCDISEPKRFVNTPVRFVYAGNLFYHRDKILGALAKAIAKVNDDTQKARLDIFSGTPVDEEVLSILNIEGASTLHNARPFEEIKQIMKDADIVLHVESFDEEQMKIVRLSFSTKITDCMQSGSMMMAIGPDSVASIDYATRIPGCVVVNNLTTLEETVRELVENHSTIINRASKTNGFAKEKAEINQLRNRLKSEFELLLKC